MNKQYYMHDFIFTRALSSITYGGYVTSDISLQLPDDTTYTIQKDDICKALLQRHGNKKILHYPKWFGYEEAEEDENEYNYLLRNWTTFNSRNMPGWTRIADALVAKYSPIENTDRYSDITDTHIGTDITKNNGSETLSYIGSETRQDGGTDSTTIDGTTVDTKSMTNTTTYSGTETTADSGSDQQQYGKKTDQTINNKDITSYEGMEEDAFKKEGSILSNSDKDDYNFPFNGNEKNHTIHTDEWTNERYGKYKDADDTTQNDPYKETTTKTYTGRSDVTTHTGTISNGDSGTDTTQYGKQTDKYFTDRTDTASETGTDTIKNGETNETTYGKSETLSYNGRKNQNDIDTTNTTTYNTENKHVEHTHGNIGLMTNQSMIESEINLRTKSILLDMIADEWANIICTE